MEAVLKGPQADGESAAWEAQWGWAFRSMRRSADLRLLAPRSMGKPQGRRAERAVAACPNRRGTLPRRSPRQNPDLWVCRSGRERETCPEVGGRFHFGNGRSVDAEAAGGSCGVFIVGGARTRSLCAALTGPGNCVTFAVVTR
jgi:hypothetical protein